MELQKGYTLYPPLSNLPTHKVVEIEKTFSNKIDVLLFIQLFLISILVVTCIETGRKHIK